MGVPVIHPELVLGTRGRKDALIIVKAVRDKRDPMHSIISQSYGWPEQAKEVIVTLWESVKANKKVYVIGPDFLEAISSVDNDIPLDLLPKGIFTAYIGFPNQEKIKYKNNNVVGFYLSTRQRPGDSNIFDIMVSIHLDDSDPDNTDCRDSAPVPAAFAVAGVEVNENKVRISSASDKIGDTLITKIMNIALNIVAYIHSSQPDVSWMKPSSSMSVKERKAHVAKGNYVSSTMSIPVKVVSWNWMKPKQYSKGEWLRKLHMRWQRYGPGFSKTKLIWIEETVVRRRKDLINE